MESSNVKYTTQVKRQKTKNGKMLNQYLKIKKIGQGRFSKVKLVKDTTQDKLYAMKKYNMYLLRKKTRTVRSQQGGMIYRPMTQQVMLQIQLLKKLNHQNVIKIYQIIEEKTQDDQHKLYIIMDYMDIGDVAHWNDKNMSFHMKAKQNFETAKSILQQTVKGLDYLHSIRIIHRDIKPSNILLDSKNNIKIIDFSISTQLKTQNQKLQGSFGTHHFMAPETLQKKQPDGYDGRASDIWSLGVSFYCILFGKLPFHHDLQLYLFDIIGKGKYQFPQNINPEFVPFIPIIKDILVVEAKDRPNTKQLLERISKLQKHQI